MILNIIALDGDFPVHGGECCSYDMALWVATRRSFAVCRGHGLARIATRRDDHFREHTSEIRIYIYIYLGPEEQRWPNDASYDGPGP